MSNNLQKQTTGSAHPQIEQTVIEAGNIHSALKGRSELQPHVGAQSGQQIGQQFDRKGRYISNPHDSVEVRTAPAKDLGIDESKVSRDDLASVVENALKSDLTETNEYELKKEKWKFGASSSHKDSNHYHAEHEYGDWKNRDRNLHREEKEIRAKFDDEIKQPPTNEEKIKQRRAKESLLLVDPALGMETKKKNNQYKAVDLKGDENIRNSLNDHVSRGKNEVHKDYLGKLEPNLNSLKHEQLNEDMKVILEETYGSTEDTAEKLPGSKQKQLKRPKKAPKFKKANRSYGTGSEFVRSGQGSTIEYLAAKESHKGHKHGDQIQSHKYDDELEHHRPSSGFAVENPTLVEKRKKEKIAAELESNRVFAPSTTAAKSEEINFEKLQLPVQSATSIPANKNNQRKGQHFLAGGKGKGEIASEFNLKHKESLAPQKRKKKGSIKGEQIDLKLAQNQIPKGQIQQQTIVRNFAADIDIGNELEEQQEQQKQQLGSKSGKMEIESGKDLNIGQKEQQKQQLDSKSGKMEIESGKDLDLKKSGLRDSQSLNRLGADFQDTSSAPKMSPEMKMGEPKSEDVFELRDDLSEEESLEIGKNVLSKPERPESEKFDEKNDEKLGDLKTHQKIDDQSQQQSFSSNFSKEQESTKLINQTATSSSITTSTD